MIINKYFENNFNIIKGVTPEHIREVANIFLPENMEDKKYVIMLRDPLKKD